MIQEIHIENFQSHKNTTLKLSNGVNVITGSSDSGKTAIIRALRWLVWNRPGGDEFRSNWGGNTEVVLKTNDYFISRTKSSENMCQLNDTVFKAFGLDVPKEIQTALNLTEINLQQQLDSPFLLSETPGNVAQYFNKIAKLDKIDSTTQNINKAIRKINSDIQYQQEQLLKYNEKLSEFPDLDKIETELKRIERKEVRLEDLYTDTKRLDKIINRIDTIDETIAEENEIIGLENTVNCLFELIDKRETIEEDLVNLAGLVEDIGMTNVKSIEFDTIIKTEQIVNVVLQQMADKRDLTGQIQRLNGLTYKIVFVNKTLVKTQDNASDLEIVFHEAMGSVCLLCGSKLK